MTVTLRENDLIRRQYDPAAVKVASFDTPLSVTKGDSVYHGPCSASLTALDRMLAKDPRLRIRRTGPGEYIFWTGAKAAARD